MQADGGTCLRRLNILTLDDTFRSPAQVAVFMRAVAAGHGLPELEALSINSLLDEGDGPMDEPCGASLAHALCPPRGLPRLLHLLLDSLNLTDLQDLVDALADRPHAIQPLAELSLNGCVLGPVEGLIEAMGPGGPLAGVKVLELCPPEDDEEGQQRHRWLMGLFEAVAGGAGRQLEMLTWSYLMESAAPINRLLQVRNREGGQW